MKVGLSPNIMMTAPGPKKTVSAVVKVVSTVDPIASSAVVAAIPKASPISSLKPQATTPPKFDKDTVKSSPTTNTPRTDPLRTPGKSSPKTASEEDSNKKIRWNEEPYIQQIREAVAVVLSGISASKVAKARNIPGRTLRRYVMNERKRLNKPRVLKKTLKQQQKHGKPAQAARRVTARISTTRPTHSTVANAVPNLSSSLLPSTAAGIAPVATPVATPVTNGMRIAAATAVVPATSQGSTPASAAAPSTDGEESPESKVRWKVEPHLSKIKKAVALAMSGQSASKVATEHGIPARTLRRYVMQEREATAVPAISSLAPSADKRRRSDTAPLATVPAMSTSLASGATSASLAAPSRSPASGGDAKRMRPQPTSPNSLVELHDLQESFPRKFD